MALWPIETAVMKQTAWLGHTAITSTLVLADSKARVVLTFTGAPSNGQTVTVDGHVYTFKTTLTGAADEVLIGGTAALCASHLFDAITDNSANEGTTYGTGTVANATCGAVAPTTGALTIQYLTTGVAVNGVQEGLTNATLDAVTMYQITTAPFSFIGAGNVELRAIGNFGSSIGGGAPSQSRNYAY